MLPSFTAKGNLKARPPMRPQGGPLAWTDLGLSRSGEPFAVDAATEASNPEGN